jgi:hypothetical protein
MVARRRGAQKVWLEEQVATVGQRLLGRLVELQWEDIDAHLLARYRARHAPGSIVADGWAALLVASRFGTLAVRRHAASTKVDNGCTHGYARWCLIGRESMHLVGGATHPDMRYLEM